MLSLPMWREERRDKVIPLEDGLMLRLPIQSEESVSHKSCYLAFIACNLGKIVPSEQRLKAVGIILGALRPGLDDFTQYVLAWSHRDVVQRVPESVKYRLPISDSPGYVESGVPPEQKLAAWRLMKSKINAGLHWHAQVKLIWKWREFKGLPKEQGLEAFNEIIGEIHPGLHKYFHTTSAKLGSLVTNLCREGYIPEEESLNAVKTILKKLVEIEGEEHSFYFGCHGHLVQAIEHLVDVIPKDQREEARRMITESRKRFFNKDTFSEVLKKLEPPKK